MSTLKPVKPRNSLEEALGFYGSYHMNPINQIIHVCFVPCIIWTAFVLFSYVSVDTVLGRHVYLFDLLGIKTGGNFYLSYINDNLVLGGGSLLFTALSIYYLTLTFVPAATYISLMSVMLVTACKFWQTTPNAWMYALALHVFSWYMQLHPGHGIFEKRAAALNDNFIKGTAMGPLFAWMEVLFFLGWNPALKQRIHDLAHYNIAVWKESLKKGK